MGCTGKHPREEIAGGHWQTGARLPPEWQLVEGYGVSRGTLREPLQTLTPGTLIRSARGAVGGTFVIAPARRGRGRQIGDFIVLRLRPRELTASEVYHAHRVLERNASGWPR